MALVTGVTLPSNGDRIKVENYNDPINKILAQVNGNLDSTNILAGSLPWETMAAFTNKIPSSAMQDSGNLEKFRTEAGVSFVASGLIWSALTGLNATMTSGVIYGSNGTRVAVGTVATRAFSASQDTYVSVDTSGGIGYSTVTVNAAAPTLAAGSQWIAKVTTNGSTIVAIQDMRTLSPTSTLWWQQIGRATLASSSNSIVLSTIPTRRYLKIIASLIPTGGTVDHGMRFNGDTSANYSFRRSSGGSPDGAGGNQSYFYLDTASLAVNHILANTELVNIANQEKIGYATVIGGDQSGAGFSPLKVEYAGKWINTTNQINQVSSFNTAGTGMYAAGSELIVLGHD